MSRTIRVAEAVYQELKRRAKAEGRTLQGVVDRLLLGSGGGENHGESPARVAAWTAEVSVCLCGHPGVSHRPKCLVRGCGCVAYQEGA